MDTAALKQQCCLMLEAICDCAGKSEEVTGSLILSMLIETWTILQQFLPPERFVTFDFNKTKRVSATVGSIHDPTAVCSHPHHYASMSHVLQACSVHQSLFTG